VWDDRPISSVALGEAGVRVDELFDEDDYYTGPPVDDEAIRAAEVMLGYTLPASYKEIIRWRNGGRLRRRCFPTAFRSSWAEDHIGVMALLGITGTWGIATETGSAYLIEEWGYPDIGVVLCETPSAGHDTVMLDYRQRGPAGEPTVAYIDEDGVARHLADSFDEFLSGLTVCDPFD
jgi:hypothetical protein